MSGREETRLDETDTHDISEQAVAGYLRRHPDFFQDKASLLSDLRIPHDAGGAVSLVERQIVVLRDTSERQQKQLDSLIQIARENDRLNEQLHRLILGMISSEDIGKLLDMIQDHLRHDFSADFVAIRILGTPRDERFQSRPEFITDPAGFTAQFQRLLGADKPYCGRLTTEQLEYLYGELAETIGSSALMPLGKQGKIGLLTICSYDRGRFYPSADTAFLGRMSEVISAAVEQHLQPGD